MLKFVCGFCLEAQRQTKPHSPSLPFSRLNLEEGALEAKVRSSLEQFLLSRARVRHLHNKSYHQRGSRIFSTSVNIYLIDYPH